jgi:hypothetical protein
VRQHLSVEMRDSSRGVINTVGIDPDSLGDGTRSRICKDTLIYLMGSRYCETDPAVRQPAELFGSRPGLGSSSTV